MNCIDKAFAEFINGEDFVQKMADIYEYPEVIEELAKHGEEAFEIGYVQKGEKGLCLR